MTWTIWGDGKDPIEDPIETGLDEPQAREGLTRLEQSGRADCYAENDDGAVIGTSQATTSPA